jgi:hypothetical protein
MPPDSPRTGRVIHVNLSPEARDGWQRLADAHGADVTAVLEVIGRHLADHPRAASLRLGDLGDAARQLSADRRRRSTR